MLKENGYQESIISTVFKRITNNHSFPQSQQQAVEIQVGKMRMSKTTVRWTYQWKLLCKPKDRVATEDKNNIVYEIDSNNTKAVY